MKTGNKKIKFRRGKNEKISVGIKLEAGRSWKL
jgi:hypothetical protein